MAQQVLALQRGQWVPAAHTELLPGSSRACRRQFLPAAMGELQEQGTAAAQEWANMTNLHKTEPWNLQDPLMLPVTSGKLLLACLHSVLQCIPYRVPLACNFSSFVLKVPVEGKKWVLRHFWSSLSILESNSFKMPKKSTWTFPSFKWARGLVVV